MLARAALLFCRHSHRLFAPTQTLIFVRGGGAGAAPHEPFQYVHHVSLQQTIRLSSTQTMLAEEAATDDGKGTVPSVDHVSVENVAMQCLAPDTWMVLHKNSTPIESVVHGTENRSHTFKAGIVMKDKQNSSTGRENKRMVESEEPPQSCELLQHRKEEPALGFHNLHSEQALKVRCDSVYEGGIPFCSTPERERGSRTFSSQCNDSDSVKKLLEEQKQLLEKVRVQFLEQRILLQSVLEGMSFLYCNKENVVMGKDVESPVRLVWKLFVEQLRGFDYLTEEDMRASKDCKRDYHACLERALHEFSQTHKCIFKFLSPEDLERLAHGKNLTDDHQAAILQRKLQRYLQNQPNISDRNGVVANHSHDEVELEDVMLLICCAVAAERTLDDDVKSSVVGLLQKVVLMLRTRNAGIRLGSLEQEVAKLEPAAKRKSESGTAVAAYWGTACDNSKLLGEVKTESGTVLACEEEKHRRSSHIDWQKDTCLEGSPELTASMPTSKTVAIGKTIGVTCSLADNVKASRGSSLQERIENKKRLVKRRGKKYRSQVATLGNFEEKKEKVEKEIW